MTVKRDKIYVFSRAKKDCSVLNTHYNKFLNFMMRKVIETDLFLYFINY